MMFFGASGSCSLPSRTLHLLVASGEAKRSSREEHVNIMKLGYKPC